MKKDIRAIIFDIGGVLGQSLNGLENLFQSKTSIPAVEFLSRRDKSTKALLELMRGKYDYGKYLKNDLLNPEWDIDPWYTHEIIMQHLLSPFEESALDTLRKLKELGTFRLFIASDIEKKWVEDLTATEIGQEMFGLVEKSFFSYDLGALKNEKGTYTRISDMIGIEPESILVIDDRKDNIAAAERQNMQATLFGSRNLLNYVLRNTYSIPI